LGDVYRIVIKRGKRMMTGKTLGAQVGSRRQIGRGVGVGEGGVLFLASGVV